MALPPVFVDTMALVALANRSDEHHAESKAVFSLLIDSRRRLLTSDWVLGEFLGTAARPPLRQAALRIVKRMQDSPSVHVVAASRSSWRRTLRFYAAHHDKAWSFVDCSSILICEAHGIQEVFTRDHHFEQAGLQVLLGRHGA